MELATPTAGPHATGRARGVGAGRQTKTDCCTLSLHKSVPLAGFAVNVTVDLFAPAAVAACVVTAVGAWPGARPWSQTLALKAGANTVVVPIPADETKGVRLWHPHGHGAQPLYNLTVTAAPQAQAAVEAAAGLGGTHKTHKNGMHTEVAAAVATRRIGFRHVALVTIDDTDPAVVAAAAAENGNGDFTMMFRCWS